MSKCEKLLERARASGSNLTFAELTSLAECYGWFFKRNTGSSHVIYFNAAAPAYKTLSFVKGGGRVASWQVTNLLAAIELLEK